VSVKIITPPTEIITVAEAADFMRVDFPDDESDRIEAMITSARQWCEDYLQRAIGVQTLETILCGFPSAGRKQIHLRPPVISVTSVNYIDNAGAEEELTVDEDYYLSIDSEPAEIIPVTTWPAAMNIANSVKVRYQAGYNDPADSPSSNPLPSPIRTAMLMQIADLYENRTAQAERPLAVNQTLERMLSMYRLEMGI
jgi:uncharacterized phiE125 gp8 family phage protein